jgi:acyl carrier protein
MTDASIFDRLTPLLRDVFYDDDLVATPVMTAGEVSGWDSLGHVRLLVEVEREFSIRFSATEVSTLRNLGQLADLIERKSRPII